MKLHRKVLKFLKKNETSMLSYEDQKALLAHLPNFLAVNYQTMLDATDDQVCVQVGLKTFSLGLRFLTIIVTSQYLIQDERSVSDPHLNTLLRERLPLGDLQNWSNVFLTALKAYEGLEDRFFIPELYEMYWDTSDVNQHRPRGDIEQNVRRLVALSNDFHSRKNLPSDGAGWKELADEIKLRMGELLGRLRFLANYELLRILDIQGQKYIAEKHVGLATTKIEFEYENEILRSDWYYIGHERRRFLQLNPLLIPWQLELNSTALFERMTQYERLLYFLAQTGASLTNENHLSEFVELMNIIDQFKAGVLGKKELSWLQVTATAEEISTTRMATVSGKYDPTVFLQRHDLVEQFTTFMTSEAHCFVLTGKSGAGKSNFVLSLANEYKSEQTICFLMLDASQIDTKKGLNLFVTEEFRRRWGWQTEEMQDVFEEIGKLPDMGRHTIVLVLDAVNENENPLLLLKQINEMIQQPWQWLKILVTSRPEAWRQMYNNVKLAEGLFYQTTTVTDTDTDEHLPLSAYTVRPFSQAELPLVYERYRVKYKLKSEYDELSIGIQELIQEPLQLWMVADTYQGKEVDTALSKRLLIEAYLNALLDTKRLRREDLGFLRTKLVPLMAPRAGVYTNSLTAGALEEIGIDLLEQVFSEGLYSTGERVNASFQRLADAQIVLAQVRGIDSDVHFKYERFYDYFVGEYLHTKTPEWYGNVVDGYQALLAATEKYPYLWGAVQVALGLVLEEGKVSDVKALGLNDNPLMRYMLAPVLIEYAQEKPEIVREIVNDLLALRPPRQMLGRAEYPRDVLGAKEIAMETAYALEDTDALCHAVCDPAELVSEIGVRFVYALDRSNHRKALEILEKVGQQTMHWGLPQFNILRRFIFIAMLLLIEGKLNDELNNEKNELWDIILRTARRVAYVNQGSSQIFGNLFRTFLVRLFTRVIIRLLEYMSSSRKESGDRPTSANLEELIAIYKGSVPEAKRQSARDLIPYLDRTYTKSLAEVEKVLLAAFTQSYGWSTSIANQVASTYGFFAPDWAQDLCHRIYDCDNGKGEVRLDAAIIWYQVVKRQPQIAEEWLNSGRTLIRKCLDNNQHGYGRFITDLSGVQQYPLLFYIALYNKKYPQRPNDLVEHYLAQAENTKDRVLLLHVIDSLGDRRAYLINYMPVLNSFIPYIHADDEVRTHLIISLAAIRGMFPDQIDHFLLSTEAPSEFTEEVRRKSYGFTSLSLYLRFADFIYDLSIYGNERVRVTLMEVYTSFVNGKSFGQALESVTRLVLNAFYGEKIVSGK
jgi:hypothetical protein